MLLGKNIFLRPVADSDSEILYKWENDRTHWMVSGTKKPFTRKQIKEFIQNQTDIYLDKQLRLMICIKPDKAVGCIDLFAFNKKNAGVGVLIEKKHRRNGYAAEALSLLIDYSFNILNLNELFCDIPHDNKASLALFKKLKFKPTGKKTNICSLILTSK